MKKKLTAALMLTMSMFMGMTAYAGEWKQDNVGYWYSETDGSYAVSQWKEVDGKWYHFDAAGYMQTGWISEGDVRYYLDPASGAMWAGTTQVVDGVTYQFDASGAAKQVAQNASGGWNGSTYASTVMNYAVTVPDNYVNVDISILGDLIDYQQVICEFAVGRPDNEVMVMGIYYPQYSKVTAAEMSAMLASSYSAEGSPFILREKATVEFGSAAYEMLKLNFSGDLYQDLYIKKEGDNILLLQAVYVPEHEAEVVQIMSTLHNVR